MAAIAAASSACDKAAASLHTASPAPAAVGDAVAVGVGSGGAGVGGGVGVGGGGGGAGVESGSLFNQILDLVSTAVGPYSPSQHGLRPSGGAGGAALPPFHPSSMHAVTREVSLPLFITSCTDAEERALFLRGLSALNKNMVALLRALRVRVSPAHATECAEQTGLAEQGGAALTSVSLLVGCLSQCLSDAVHNQSSVTRQKQGASQRASALTEKSLVGLSFLWRAHRKHQAKVPLPYPLSVESPVLPGQYIGCMMKVGQGGRKTWSCLKLHLSLHDPQIRGQIRGQYWMARAESLRAGGGISTLTGVVIGDVAPKSKTVVVCFETGSHRFTLRGASFGTTVVDQGYAGSWASTVNSAGSGGAQLATAVAAAVAAEDDRANAPAAAFAGSSHYTFVTRYLPAPYATRLPTICGETEATKVLNSDSLNRPRPGHFSGEHDTTEESSDLPRVQSDAAEGEWELVEF
eukprot:Rhum_TRINITY_DN15264_c16_g1::Rhum_TRINITY_DN15264_c16_g1_i1::g.149285::m.149285